jgi:hypothetical protein
VGSVVGTDVFRFAPCEGPCCELECGCESGLPKSFSVVFEHVENRDCNNCEDINNNTYIVTNPVFQPDLPGGSCRWKWTYVLPSTICGAQEIRVYVSASTPLALFLSAHLVNTGVVYGTSFVSVRKQLARNVNCLGVNGLVLDENQFAFFNRCTVVIGGGAAADTIATVTADP